MDTSSINYFVSYVDIKKYDPEIQPRGYKRGCQLNPLDFTPSFVLGFYR